MTTKEKAEKLARGCAEQSYTLPLDQDWATDKIINYIPLEELLAVAEAASAASCEAYHISLSDPAADWESECRMRVAHLQEAIVPLITKLKKAGVES